MLLGAHALSEGGLIRGRGARGDGWRRGEGGEGGAEVNHPLLVVSKRLAGGRELLAVPARIAANFHASLLPAYRGRSPLFWAIRHGETHAGLTVHVMDQGLDTGDILYQRRAAIDRCESVASLYGKMIEEGAKLVPRLVADVRTGSLAP